MAYTMSGSTGDTARPMRPSSTFGSPFWLRAQVSPPSRLFHTPEPGPPLISDHTCRRLWYDDAYITSGFSGSISRSLTPVCSSISSTLRQVSPPSVVL